METATETNQNNRELTATEIKIAIAQIEDRLMRVVNAQSDLTYFVSGGSEQSELDKLMNEVTEELQWAEEERIINKKSIELRARYDIPEGVHIFHADLDCALIKETSKKFISYISSFVKGKLTEDAAWGMILFFEEFAECDYGWILIERPMGFYNQPSREDMDDIQNEIISIGTRSRSKNKYLTSKIGSPFT
jgi:hypothetical protein